MSSLQSEGEHPFVRHYHGVLQCQKLKYIMVPEDEMQELMALYGPDNFVERKVSEPAEHQQHGTIYRRFVRWNPNFFQYFELNLETRKWEPKLGEHVERTKRSSDVVPVSRIQTIVTPRPSQMLIPTAELKPLLPKRNKAQPQKQRQFELKHH
jgi:hypothetical protein